MKAEIPRNPATYLVIVLGPMATGSFGSCCI